MIRTRPLLAAAVCAAISAPLALAGGALAHPERPAHFPDHTKGEVPTYRTTGPSIVVCKPDSRRRILRSLKGRGPKTSALRRKNLRLVKRCRFRHIQQAVDAASSGTRILVLPGVYREEPSRANPEPDKRCADKYVPADGPDPITLGGLLSPGPRSMVASYEYQYHCPNAQNLIAIMGDSPEDKDRECDRKCNIQIEGTARRSDVLIDGSREKLNVIRADRADGVYLRNFTVQFSDFNNLYVLETNGFVFDRITSRYSREYGFLSFTSDNGLYQHLDTYGSGDSGIYPGSGPEGHCRRYGIEIRNVDSHHNNLGYSGTAGNGVWAHDNKFHHNGTGIVTDSFAPGHPGMPQDCAKWEDNDIYSNNLFELFSDERQAYCRKTPWRERDPKKVCSTFQNPTGTGVLIAGGNGNIVRGNRIWDNWRYGAMLLHVPATARGEDNPAATFDTSFDNKFTNNLMGVAPGGSVARNGVDFWWTEQGSGNCWQTNSGPGGVGDITTDPLTLPGCPGSSIFMPGNQVKLLQQVPCAMWDPNDELLDKPPGCDWMTPVPKPS
jgi:hypothetical protein